MPSTLNLLLYTAQPYKQAQKIVVLTGGNKGIGLGVLKKLLECEMTVVLGK
jgi:NAD(P)-dependent dehydrogenase (short-subunit alcohol dehydrogenase family)